MAQSHSPYHRCVRFKHAVAGSVYSLPSGLLCLTRAGLSPAGTRQLRLTHPLRLRPQVRRTDGELRSKRPTMNFVALKSLEQQSFGAASGSGVCNQMRRVTSCSLSTTRPTPYPIKSYKIEAAQESGTGRQSALFQSDAHRVLDRTRGDFHISIASATSTEPPAASSGQPFAFATASS